MNTKTLLLGLSACALTIASVQAQGFSMLNAATPMPAVQEPQAPPSQTSPDQTTPNPDQAKTTTFTGTIVKDGEQYVLRDSSGGIYKLDDSSRAQAFEGKTVKVTGRLDADSKVIHVDSIQALAS
ncbi:MAG TPA: DUF5818 domain-containing protein [Terracidiphilus sp.]